MPVPNKRYICKELMLASVVWLPAWLGNRYAKLYLQFGEEPFDFISAQSLLNISDKLLLNVLSRLRRDGYLCVFNRLGRKKYYRLFAPESAIPSSAIGVRNLESVKQGTYAHLLLKMIAELGVKYRDRLVSVVVFGSVARGSAKSHSDVDVLTVIEGLGGTLASRIEELLAVEHGTRVGDEIKWLYTHGIMTHISFHPYTCEEMARFRMLFLDIVEDGIALLDRDRFFERLRAGYRSLLREMGAKRRVLPDDRWYWVMNPEAELGTVRI